MKTNVEILAEVLMNVNLLALQKAVLQTEHSVMDVLDIVWGVQDAKKPQS